ncbi:MAG: SUMF1/EgtB/PvdO family nonheme iron enzyme [Acidobacteria bacterium]|nr:SUMF1/EgtB/PvdO family nonheme iron enzyme [Acidobacteriota bacterium]
MAKKIVFENVPLNKTIPNLLEILDPISTVQWIFMLTDPNTQQFTGKAYVELWSDTEAEIVVDKWHNQLWDENTIEVKILSDSEPSPEKEEDKDKILNAPVSYIYSVIRFQVTAPPQAIIFVDDFPKVEVDEMGNGVVRSLLPGKYNIKVGFGDYLLAEENITVNCEEEAPRMKVTMDSSVTQAMGAVSSGLESTYSTIEMISASGGPVTTNTRATPLVPLSSTNTTSTKAATKVAPVVNSAQFTTLSLNVVEEKEVKTIGTKAKPASSKTWIVLAVLVITVVVASLIIRQAITKNTTSTPGDGTDKEPVVKEVLPPTPQGMVYIPGGKIIIGRNNTDDEYQKPVHEEVIQKGYFLDKTEVTNEDYYQYVQDTRKKPPKNWGGERPPSEILQMPVTTVNWNDSLAYCQWRGTRKGLVTRLPTETEWEHAARGEKNYVYPWGNDWLEGYANANSPKGKIAPVGSNPKDTSPYGLVDMAGNVREWTMNDFSLYSGSKGKAEPGTKAARGGAFSDPKDVATNTFRSFLPPNNDDLDRTGFRCLCELPEQK